FQAEDGIRDLTVTGVQTCALPILLSAIAKQYSLLSVADNTFATPFIQRPIEFGFDIVVHSVTKYINGHSDMIGGIAIVGDNPVRSEERRVGKECRCRWGGEK